MKNNLKLHEAVAVILLNQPRRTAKFQLIADEVEKRQLYSARKGGISLEKQIELRTAISSSKYKNWFELIAPDTIKLK
jgi:hypothetical protein